MRKVFWDNPYQSHLETRVISVDNHCILFEETIAFSFSGGQESDKAYVNGLAIIHSEIEGNLQLLFQNIFRLRDELKNIAVNLLRRNLMIEQSPFSCCS